MATEVHAIGGDVIDVATEVAEIVVDVVMWQPKLMTLEGIS